MSWISRQPIHLDSCASTNDEAAARARDGAPHGTVVTADHQTAGRGRRGRSWHSPAAGNLYLSLILRPAMPPEAVPTIALAAGLAVADAVEAAGVVPELKWPNDVLVGGRKLAGVLAEMSSRGGAVDHAIVGIGINLASREFPAELADRATSLALAGGDPDRDRLLASLLPALELWIDRLVAGGVATIAAAWRQRAYRGPVQVTLDGQPVVGTPVELADDGALIFEDERGLRHRVVAGDVELLG